MTPQPQQTYQLELHITIRPEGNFSQGLEVREQVKVRADTFLEISRRIVPTFLEVAAILAKFHELTLTMKEGK